MISEKFYIEKFLDRADADRLLIFSLRLPPTRKVILPWGNLARFISLGTYAEFPSAHVAKNYGATLSLAAAPDEVRSTAAMLTEFAGKAVNYLSFIAYLNERDHMKFHQHAEDRSHADQSVWVLSLGEVRAVTIRPVGCTDARKYETIYPAHGSLYILPSGYNTTHEHAILDSKTPCGVRVGINCKHVEPPGAATDRAVPRIYDCHAGKKYPAGHGHSCRQEETDRTGGEVEEQDNAGHRSLVQPSRVWIHRPSGKRGWQSNLLPHL